jgi:hypothetical protein
VVRTGRRQTLETLGAELFQYYSNNPSEGRGFTGHMTSLSIQVADEIARVLNTSSAKLVVDVGRGVRAFTSERGAPFTTAGFARLVEQAGKLAKLAF